MACEAVKRTAGARVALGLILAILFSCGTPARASPASFLCADGSRIAVDDVCDGRPHCPDASDEHGRMCWRVLCPAGTYRCAYGACVARSARCNGSDECLDGSDEFHCNEADPEDFCSAEEYRCLNGVAVNQERRPVRQQCVALSELCNGRADCSDGSDEGEETCREYDCPETSYRCSYGGCVDWEVVCDGTKDCVDGTDEEPALCGRGPVGGCTATEDCRKLVCGDGEFGCANGKRCIAATRVCDGAADCPDLSDEEIGLCLSRRCPDDRFRCAYGGCIRLEGRCNGRIDCYDSSDEFDELCGVRPLSGGSCRLPGPKAATRYTVRGCRTESRCRPGRVVPELTRLDYECDAEGGQLEGSATVYCQSSRWLPTIPTCPLGNETTNREVTCPAVPKDHGAIKSCQVEWGSHEGWLSCERALPIGTRINLECSAFYERVRGSPSATCLHDGTWSAEPLSCRPICGMRESSAAALIVRGWEATALDALPWHATLFSHEDGHWKFFCGGTLIAERVVLTAGHCVWRTRAETVRVAVGILARELREAISEDTAQLLDVQRIHVQDSYQDHEGNYGSDLALLILKEPALLTSRVVPACLPAARDRDGAFDETLTVARDTGEPGLITGMGLTENDTFSPSLRTASMRIIADGECRERHKRDFRKYLTYTSFCAGWMNGTGPCNGDSGGGLVLRRPNSSVWEVHGVVSISPRRIGTAFCDSDYYTIFTKVSVYAQWVRKIVQLVPILGPPDVDGKPNRDNVQLESAFVRRSAVSPGQH